MHRSWMTGLAAGAVALSAGGAFLVLRHGDPLVEGRKLMEQGDMHRASLYLREAVRNQPDSAEAAFRLGVVDLALTNAAAAELELKRARDHGYDPKQILLPLGQAYLQQHHYRQLLSDFDPATSPPWAIAEVKALRSSADLALGNIQAASDEAAAAVAAAPDDATTQLAAARVALARGDEAAASAILSRILQANPKDPDARLVRAGMALHDGKPAAAMTEADAVLAEFPRRVDARLMRVRALATLGREKEARTLVEEVLHNARHDPGANYLRMVLAMRSHDWQAANESLDIISPVIGSLPRGLFYAGLIKMQVGQPAQAEEAVTKFLTVHPDDIDARKLMAFIDLARRRPSDARAQLQDMVNSGHADADALDLFGRAQAMSGNVKAAEITLSKAQALAPRDENIVNRLAGVELALGETNAADQTLRRSLALKPDQAGASETLITGLLQRGDIHGAEAALADLKRAGGDAEVTGILQADIQLANFDVRGAKITLQSLLDKMPESERTTLLLARVDRQLGDPEAAESLLAGLLQHHPADEAAVELDLSLLLSQGKIDQAVTLAEAAHEAGAGNSGITAALAAVYLRAHDPDRAIALLDRAGAVSQDPALTLLRARALDTAKRNAAARDAYRDVLESQPGNVAARRELAMLQAKTDDTDGARATIQAGLKIAPGNPLLMGSLVGLELKAGGTAGALRTASTLAADPANLPAALLLPGDIWAAAGNLPRAADAYLAAYQSTPNATLAEHAADALAHAGRVPEATALLNRWLASHPDDAGALTVLSALEMQSNQLAEAESHLQKLVALRPSDAPALNNLAWLAGRNGDLDSALALAKRAYFIDPQPSMADTLGWILVRHGDAADALPLLQGASGADQLYHYAAGLVQSGQKDKAKPVLQKALAQKASFDERPDAVKLLNSLGQ